MSHDARDGWNSRLPASSPQHAVLHQCFGAGWTPVAWWVRCGTCVHKEFREVLYSSSLLSSTRWCSSMCVCHDGTLTQQPCAALRSSSSSQQGLGIQASTNVLVLSSYQCYCYSTGTAHRRRSRCHMWTVCTWMAVSDSILVLLRIYQSVSICLSTSVKVAQALVA